MSITTVNPYTEERIKTYTEEKIEAVAAKVKEIKREQALWAENVDARVSYLKNVLKPNLAKNEREIAERMTQEMGKPISQSIQK